MTFYVNGHVRVKNFSSFVILILLTRWWLGLQASVMPNSCYNNLLFVLCCENRMLHSSTTTTKKLKFWTYLFWIHFNKLFFYALQLTKKDQNPTDNKFLWVRSQYSECSLLSGIYEGYERLVVQPGRFEVSIIILICILILSVSMYIFNWHRPKIQK